MTKRINFTLTQFEYVLAVHKFGHFAKAAQSCLITQPTLSMQIQKLEEDLGVVLFDRSKKPILLTEVGEKIIKQIQSVMFESKKIEEIISVYMNGEESGLLTLGIIPTIAPYLLPRLLPTFEEFYPHIEVNILELQTHQIVTALENDEIDVGVLATPLNIQAIIERAVYYEPFYLYCRKDHELASLKNVTSNSLKSDDIWLLQEGHCLRGQVLDVCNLKQKKGRARNFKFESGNLETLKNLVRAYGGYTLLPYLATRDLMDHTIKQLPENTKLITFTEPIPVREIGLVYRRTQHKSHLIDLLEKAINKSVPKVLQKNFATNKKKWDVLPID